MSETPPSGTESTCTMLEAAYPDGLADSDYLPLLSVLGEDMSHRQLTAAVCFVFGRDPAIVLNDVYRAQNPGWRSNTSVEYVRSHLRNFGYDEWRSE